MSKAFKPSFKKAKLPSNANYLYRKRLVIFIAVASFSVIAVSGTSLLTGNNQQSGVGSSSASAQEPADINNDNTVNVFDLSYLLGKWNTNDSTADLNKDSTVNVFDLSMLLGKWGAVGGSAFQSNCIIKPSACGYPDETNTGVPAGTTLTNSGSITITQDGTVIQNLNISGEVIIKANNVTIRKTRITSGDYYPIRYFDNNNTGLLIEDSEIIGTNSDVTASVSFANYTLRRVNVHGGADGIKADSNVLVEDSYIHDLAVGPTTHNDGVQTTGGSNVTLRHNTCKLSTTLGTTNACIQMGDETGGNDNWLVTNNLFDGGGYTINASSDGTNRVVTNNRFTRNYEYGIGYMGNATWAGNYYDDDGSSAN